MTRFFIISIFVSFPILILIPKIFSTAWDRVSLTSGGKNWSKTLTLLGLQYHDVEGGIRFLRLGVNRAKDADIDLSFEEDDKWDEKKYRLITGLNVDVSSSRVYSGSFSASFHGENPLVFEPLESSLFRRSNVDFTFDFWVLPLRLSDGEQIFEYSAVINQNTPMRGRPQNIIAGFEKGRIVWYFQNTFMDIYGHVRDIELRGNPLKKGTWQRHTLRYYGELGMIEILDGGHVSDVVYVTPTGREDIHIYELGWQLSEQQSCSIGKFSGYLDNFRILPYYEENIVDIRYVTRGTLVTDPYDLKGKTFNSFLLVGENEKDSSFDIYIRFAPYKVDFYYGRIPWRSYSSGNIYTGPTDRYVQFRVDFFAGIGTQDGLVLKDMIVEHSILPSPPTPYSLKLEPQSQGVLVKWKPVYIGYVSGYKLYFGEQSYNYFGKFGEYTSPIDVGNVSEYYIDGLELGKMYYFSLVSYSDDPLRGESAFSPEVAYLHH